MKKTLSILVLGAFLASIMAVGLARPSWAAGTGFIDTQKVFMEYKETKKAQEQLSKAEEDYRKQADNVQKEIDKLKADKNVTEAQLKEKQKKLEDGLAPKRDELIKLNQDLTTKIQAQIVEATKAAAKDVGLDLVLDKQVIITGGIDLTDKVLTKLNGAAPAK